MLIEQPKVQKHAQPAKGWPKKQQIWGEMLKEYLLSKQMLENVHNRLKDHQRISKMHGNAKRVLIEQTEAQKQ